MRFHFRYLAGATAWLGLLAAAAFAGEVEVFFDIKPTSCPNPVNPHPGQRLSPTFPTALLGTDQTAAASFRASSLTLVLPGGGGRRAGEILLPPIATHIEDVATPFEGNEECGCTTDGPDGFDDLTVHFDGEEVLGALESFPNGAQIPLCIVGELVDGTPFTACDCVIVVGPLPVDESSWGAVKATYR